VLESKQHLPLKLLVRDLIRLVSVEVMDNRINRFLNALDAALAELFLVAHSVCSVFLGDGAGISLPQQCQPSRSLRVQFKEWAGIEALDAAARDLFRLF
jgi:hypothetical protein